MKLYQPVMFVGLGGTGCDIGAELERRLREEICGPDGHDFTKKSGRGNMLPYQLPSCLQFVYADMNQAELDRLPDRVVPPGHAAAARPTAHYVSGLVPDVVSYPELALRLRLHASSVVGSWLPPQSRDEPKVNPLHRGAGQFPTIGRASLFGTFLEGATAPVERDILAAVGKLAGSAEDLRVLGGPHPQSVDVFVAFSVAGGTGTGIFYDYLHLIAKTLSRNGDLRVKIYPLVLMPSAFPEGLGGGRNARLNAGRALLDLFRLVDQQNGADAEPMLYREGDRPPDNGEDVAVTYPDGKRIVMTPGTMQTGFLFAKPPGATREDMHRSIAALVMSLTGTEITTSERDAGHNQSFADSFVNQAADRQVAAQNGIGSRGVSTALVASLTTPVDELAGIVGSRLVREAIEHMVAVDGRLESTRSGIEEFLIKSGIHPVLTRQGVEHNEPASVNGAKEITAALNVRRDSMARGIDALRAKLEQDVPQLVAHFSPELAAHDMLGQIDIFKLQRIVLGHHGLRDEIERGGVRGLLQLRRAAPLPPRKELGPVPPGSPEELKDGGLFRQAKWADEVPSAARNLQNAWYDWQTKVAWAQAWDAHTVHWSRPLDRLQLDIGKLARALTEFARSDVDDFANRSDELYRKRVGASYLLPSGPGGLGHFYDQVLRRLRRKLAETSAVRESSHAADVLRALIGPQAWPEAFQISIEHSAEQAVSYLRERAKIAVKSFLRAANPGEQPILPKLEDLLIVAAGHVTESTIDPDYVEAFRGKLAGLRPADFTPQGSGAMKVLITYPAGARSEVIENYLKSAISLPQGRRITEDFRYSDIESISVVLFRTAMGVTEVDEVRDVLRLWADAVSNPRSTDLLRWRQRTGYNYGYLATREHNRVEILHRILCALWNGKASTVGSKESPERLNVRLDGNVTMTLPLVGHAKASSWGSVLREYELWALDDDDIHRRFCSELLRELPAGVRGPMREPNELYWTVRNLAKQEKALLDGMLENQGPKQQTRTRQMREFWGQTLPAALDQEFEDSPAAANLRELEVAMGFDKVDAADSADAADSLAADAVDSPDADAEGTPKADG
jgi:Tubulin like